MLWFALVSENPSFSLLVFFLLLGYFALKTIKSIGGRAIRFVFALAFTSGRGTHTERAVTTAR